MLYSTGLRSQATEARTEKGCVMAKEKSRRKPEPDDLMSRIRASSHDVVLAGLASLSRAYRADRKRTRADFSTLVAEGRRLEPQVHEVARKAWSELMSKPSKIMSLQPQSRLQSVFDERVMSVLTRLGVPSSEDMADLRAKVERLLAREPAPGKSEAGGRVARRARTSEAPRRRPAAGRPVAQHNGRRRSRRD